MTPREKELPELKCDGCKMFARVVYERTELLRECRPFVMICEGWPIGWTGAMYQDFRKRLDEALDEKGDR